LLLLKHFLIRIIIYNIQLTCNSEELKTMGDYIYKSAIELADIISSGQATSTEIVKDHLEQIKKHNPTLDAVIILLEEEALREAAKCDEETRQGQFRGPLLGVPIPINEQFCLTGTNTTVNSKMFKDWTAPEDAVVVDRLKKAGAIIMGKTNVPRNLTDYQVSGDIYPECKNPYNLEYSPGGSSGGSSAALATGMTPIELGGVWWLHPKPCQLVRLVWA
jgi:amidase